MGSELAGCKYCMITSCSGTAPPVACTAGQLSLPAFQGPSVTGRSTVSSGKNRNLQVFGFWLCQLSGSVLAQVITAYQCLDSYWHTMSGS